MKVLAEHGDSTKNWRLLLVSARIVSLERTTDRIKRKKEEETREKEGKKRGGGEDETRNLQDVRERERGKNSVVQNRARMNGQ